MPSAGHPPAVDGTQTSSDAADVTDCSDTALLITRPALASIQSLGTTAWVVLEVLALDAVDDDGELVARASARAIADTLSVSKDTAAGALRRLADAGLVERQRQHRTGGRFGLGGYVLHLPSGLTTNARAAAAIPPGAPTTPPPVARRQPTRTPRPTASPRPQRQDQLSLLDHPRDLQP